MTIKIFIYTKKIIAKAQKAHYTKSVSFDMGNIRSNLMSDDQFDSVSVLKKSNVYFGGLCVSHTVQFADGTRKTLGVLLPNPTGEALKFNTQVAERMEITSGECSVSIADGEKQVYRAGDSFMVDGNSYFTVELQDVVDYVCHYEG